MHLPLLLLLAAGGPAYEMAPRVARVGVPTALVIRPAAGGAPFQEGVEYQVRVLGMERLGEPAALRARPAEGALRVTATFPAEQEYVLQVFGQDAGRPLASLHLYAVEADLFARRPYKGDVHQHSNRSDGREEPGVVAGFNRKIGMDFMALTDHRKYAPSLEAIKAFEGVPVDLRMYPGEEVHVPGTDVHIINFGGSFSVNERAAAPGYADAVRKLAEGVKGLPDAQRDSYAACLWAFERIREGGGVGIFCHPYWVTGERYNVSEGLISRCFADRPFDAYEVIGGYWLHESESNALQVARYYAEAAAGREVPVVGVSDGHGVTRGLHGWYYTIVLAPSPEFADLRDAIRGKWSVAVEHLPQAPAARPYGPFRLVKYTSFLCREVLPAHDRLCAEEGDLMLAHAAGDKAAAGKLVPLRGRVERLYREMWGQ